MVRESRNCFHDTPTLLLSCSFHAPALLLLYSSPAPASAVTGVLLPCSFQAPIQHIPSSSPVPAQLPSFSPVLPCSALSAQLCSCPIPALLLPCSCFSPALALLQPCSCPAPGPANPSLAAFIIIISTLRLFFGTARAAFYGTRKKSEPKKGCRLASVL